MLDRDDRELVADRLADHLEVVRPAKPVPARRASIWQTHERKGARALV